MAEAFVAEGMVVSSDDDSEESEDELECLVELKDCTVSLLHILKDILGEELITRSSMGESVCAITTKCIEEIKSKEMEHFSSVLLHEIMQCFSTSKKGTLRLSTVWRKFHVMRLSPTIGSTWRSLMCLPSASDVTLQVIMKRMFLKVVHQMTNVNNQPSQVQVLSRREENVVRYIAGYVLHKMKRKFPSRSSFFGSLQTSFEDRLYETVQDYTTFWTEQIDRGGLCHANDGFYRLLKEIEYITRKYIDIRIVPCEKIIEKIVGDAIGSPQITAIWNRITSNSIPAVESNKILKAIVSLWCNIRVHSFAKKWTDKLGNKGFTKSIRKTLKQKGTEKES